MLDQGNAQLSAVGFYNPTMGQRPLDEFFGGASAGGGPLPYEVRWDAELDGGDGGWKIFLPTPHLLSYHDEDIATSDISGVTAIADGWYSLDDVTTSSTHVWLVLSVDDADGSVEAELSPAQGQPATGTTVYNTCVAEISYTAPAAAGDPPAVVIKQSLVGALHLGGQDVEVGTDLPPSGSPTRVEALGLVHLTGMTDALGNLDTNIKFDISNDAASNTTEIKIGVYYL